MNKMKYEAYYTIDGVSNDVNFHDIGIFHVLNVKTKRKRKIKKKILEDPPYNIVWYNNVKKKDINIFKIAKL